MHSDMQLIYDEKAYGQSRCPYDLRSAVFHAIMYNPETCHLVISN